MASRSLVETPNNCSTVQQTGQSTHFLDTIHQPTHPENASYTQFMTNSLKERYEQHLSVIHVSFT